MCSERQFSVHHQLKNVIGKKVEMRQVQAGSALWQDHYSKYQLGTTSTKTMLQMIKKGQKSSWECGTERPLDQVLVLIGHNRVDKRS